MDFKEYFELSDADLNYLWELFNEYGLTCGEDSHRSKGNHYFLQGICQYHSVEWKTWKRHLTKEIKDIIKNSYPQLMVQNKQFEK